MIVPRREPKYYLLRRLLWCLQPFFKRWFRLNAEGLENLPKEGPVLLLSNHSNRFDHFFISLVLRRKIYYLELREYIRNPLTRLLLQALGAIFWDKIPLERKVIMRMIVNVKRGGWCVIFPEGGMNWDGKSLPVLPAVSKLIKVLNVPVVPVVIKGNYLAFPRWANKRRKCPITLHFSKPITFDKEMPDEDITDWVQKAIDNNDNYTKVEWIKGKRPAEELTRLLWRCPECRALEGLQERNGNELVCTQCGKEWDVNLHCNIREQGANVWKPIKEYADLMVREEEIVPIDHGFDDYLENEEQVFLQSGKAVLYQQLKYPRFNKIESGKLLLTDRGLLFISKTGGKSIRYSFTNLHGRSIIDNTIFQIKYWFNPGLVMDGGDINPHTIWFEMRGESCLKWEIYYDYVFRKAS